MLFMLNNRKVVEDLLETQSIIYSKFYINYNYDTQMCKFRVFRHIFEGFSGTQTELQRKIKQLKTAKALQKHTTWTHLTTETLNMKRNDVFAHTAQENKTKKRVNHTNMIHTKSKQLSLLIQYCPESVYNIDEEHLRISVFINGIIDHKITKQTFNK